METSKVKRLSWGPDTYILNVYSTDANCKQIKKLLSPELKAELEQLKQEAQEQEENIETRFWFDEASLLMKTKGSEGFNWILSNASMTLAVNRSSKMLLLAQVRLSSEYLWKYHQLGLGALTSSLHVFLTSLFGQNIILQVSALDLAVDVFGLELTEMQKIKECFISRAQLDQERPVASTEDGMIDGPEGIKRRWKRIIGLPFGARKGQISALIYDKTHEIKYHSKKVWFWDLWQHRAEEQGFCLLPSATVHRIEIRLKRQALAQMKAEDLFHGIDLAYEIEQYLHGLWAYAVGHVNGGEDGFPDGWLRYVVPTEDSNRARWPVHPDWEVIQGAFPPLPLPPPSPYEQAIKEQEELLQEVDAYLEVHPLQTTLKRQKPSLPSPEPIVEQRSLSPFDLKPYIRERKRMINQEQAVAAFVGWASTFEAWQPRSDDCKEEIGELDISSTLHTIYERSQGYLQEKQKDFPKMVEKKRVIYSIAKQQA